LQNAVCNQAGPLCSAVSSGDDATRWINMVGAALRYEHSFGAVDFKTYGLYEASGKEDLTTTADLTPAQSRTAFANGGATSVNATQFLRYNDLGFYQAGIAATAANLTFAPDYMGGQVDGLLGLNPSGGAPMNAYVVGVTYANGPFVLGAMMMSINSQGDARPVDISQRHELGTAFGGSYKLAPGIQLVAEYQYEQRHQGGFDFSQNTPGVNGRTVDGTRPGNPVWNGYELVAGSRRGRRRGVRPPLAGLHRREPSNRTPSFELRIARQIPSVLHHRLARRRSAGGGSILTPKQPPAAADRLQSIAPRTRSPAPHR
jgi:hypothetical protein